MADEPIQQGNNLGRDPITGRFLSGHRLSVGNHGGHPADEWKWRQVIRGKATAERRETLVEVLFAKAEGGDLKAIDIIFERCDGLPQRDDNLTLHAGESVSAMVLALAEARRLLAAEVSDAD